MRLGISLSIALFALNLHADSIASYMNIANNIPKMEIQADANSQAWARSARNVLAVTTETIAETMIQGNEIAKKKGRPIFCLPPGVKLNTATMDAIIKQASQDLNASPEDRKKISVSTVAWLGVINKFPCQGRNTEASRRMAHVAAILSR